MVLLLPKEKAGFASLAGLSFVVFDEGAVLPNERVGFDAASAGLFKPPNRDGFAASVLLASVPIEEPNEKEPAPGAGVVDALVPNAGFGVLPEGGTGVLEVLPTAPAVPVVLVVLEAPKENAGLPELPGLEFVPAAVPSVLLDCGCVDPKEKAGLLFCALLLLLLALLKPNAGVDPVALPVLVAAGVVFCVFEVAAPKALAPVVLFELPFCAEPKPPKLGVACVFDAPNPKAGFCETLFELLPNRPCEALVLFVCPGVAPVLLLAAPNGLLDWPAVAPPNNGLFWFEFIPKGDAVLVAPPLFAELLVAAPPNGVDAF